MKNKNDESNMSEMTVNERLFEKGLINDFDNAILNKNKERIESILREIEVDEYSISLTLLRFGIKK